MFPACAGHVVQSRPPPTGVYLGNQQPSLVSYESGLMEFSLSKNITGFIMRAGIAKNSLGLFRRFSGQFMAVALEADRSNSRVSSRGVRPELTFSLINQHYKKFHFHRGKARTGLATFCHRRTSTASGPSSWRVGDVRRRRP